MSRHQEHGRDENALHMDKLDGMDGRDGESRRLFVRVVQFVEVLVEEWRVVHAVVPIGQVILYQNMTVNLSNNDETEKKKCRFCYLPDENGRILKDGPDVAVFGVVVINPGPSAIHDVTRQRAGDEGSNKERRGSEDDLVPFQFGREPLVGLAFPVFGAIALADVVEPMEEAADAQVNDVGNGHRRQDEIRQSFQFVILEREIAENLIRFLVLFGAVALILPMAHIFDKVDQDQQPISCQFDTIPLRLIP